MNMPKDFAQDPFKTGLMKKWELGGGWMGDPFWSQCTRTNRGFKNRWDSHNRGLGMLIEDANAMCTFCLQKHC